MRRLKSGCLSIMLAFSATVAAQQTGKPVMMEETTSFINSKLGGKCTLEVIRGVINLKWYENGTLVREDKMDIRDVDSTAIAYVAEEQAVIIPCKKGKEECVDRKLLVSKKRKFYSRLNMLVDSEKNGQALSKALRHLIRLVLIQGYASAAPFE